MERLTSRNPLTESEAMNLSLTDIYMRLKVYEDAEEQGRLVVLPCKVGDTVFTIEENYFDCENCMHKDRASYQDSIQRMACDMDVHCPLNIEEHIVEGFNIGKGKTGYAEASAPGKWGYEGLETFYGFDEKWYITREAAEEALQKTT